MDNRTGMILPEDDIPEGQRKYFTPITRDLTKIEKLASQIKIYSPCGCGSGKKFKFCCFKPTKH